MIIDAHVHLWQYNAHEFSWIEDDMRALRRDFLPEELAREIAGAGVDSAVVVQARQSIAETEWLLRCAEGSPALGGVVGWLPLGEDRFPALLERFAGEGKLCGLRHIVQAEPEGFLDSAAFNRGVGLLQSHGLPYDVLVHEHRVAEVLRFVDRHPRQLFVLDHLLKPRVRAGVLEPWATGMRALAQRDNVLCKVSGLVTEADPRAWSWAQLQPFCDTVLQAFGPARLMAGSDWPVLTLGCGYGQWWQLLRSWLSPGEQASVLGKVAQRVYRVGPARADQGREKTPCW